MASSRMRKWLGNPILALVIGLMLAGATLVFPGSLQLGITLWCLAAVVLLLALAEWRGWSFQSPVVRSQIGRAPMRQFVWQRRRPLTSQNLPMASPLLPPGRPGPAVAAYLSVKVTSGPTVVGDTVMLRPGTVSGTLPLRLDCSGLKGQRRGNLPKDDWVWSALETLLVNDDPARPLVFKPWLVGRRRSNQAQTERIPAADRVLRLEPNASLTSDFTFVEKMRWPATEDKADPPQGWASLELVFLEVGTGRDRRVVFRRGRTEFLPPKRPRRAWARKIDRRGPT